MLRLLILAALIYLLYRCYRHYRRLQSRAETNAPRSIASIRCSHCGLHLPASEAVRAADASHHYYCNSEHARLGPKPPRRH